MGFGFDNAISEIAPVFFSALVGIFAGRFVFYMLHMTVGLSF